MGTTILKKIAWFGTIVIILSGFVGGMLPQSTFAKEKPAKKITFWHYWSDYQNFLEEMASRYQLETGVEVEFQLFSSRGRDYWNKVQAAAQANRLPDLLGLADDPELLARYIKAGKILDISKAMQGSNHEWEYSFFPRTVNALYFPEYNIYNVKGGRHWGVPLSAMNIQIFYNRTLFEKAGLDPDNPPKTWDEFIQAGHQLRKIGIAPMVCGFGDLWVNQTFFRIYAWPILGKDKIRSLYVGEAPYTTPECRQILDYFVELRDKGFFYPGVAALSNKDAEVIFAHDRAGMMMNGSWAVNVFKQMNPKLDFGVMSFPVPKTAQYPMYTIGGLGRAAAITTNSNRSKEALAFLQWLTAQPQQERWARVPSGFPALIKAQDSVNPLLQPFVVKMKDLAPNLYLEERREVLEVLSKGMQLILIADSDPESVLQAVQKMKKKLK
ncbi:extracellular solute-binding protein [bacterium]|nr:extracellular solute-binding protein [bacterium]